MIDKFLHIGKNVAVIGGCCKNQLAVSECVLDSLRHIAARKIVESHVTAALTQQLRQLLQSVFKRCVRLCGDSTEFNGVKFVVYIFHSPVANNSVARVNSQYSHKIPPLAMW